MSLSESDISNLMSQFTKECVRRLQTHSLTPAKVDIISQMLKDYCTNRTPESILPDSPASGPGQSSGTPESAVTHKRKLINISKVAQSETQHPTGKYLPLKKSYICGEADLRFILFPLIPENKLTDKTNEPNSELITCADIKQMYFARGDRPIEAIKEMVDFYSSKIEVEKFYIGVTYLTKAKTPGDKLVHLHGGMNNRFTNSYMKLEFNVMICLHIVSPQKPGATESATKIVGDIEKELFEHYNKTKNQQFKLATENEWDKPYAEGRISEDSNLLYMVLKCDTDHLMSVNSLTE